MKSATAMSNVRSGPYPSSVIRHLSDVLVGGVNSPVRAFKHVGDAPLLVRGGQGSQLVDIAGRHYMDLIMGWGALIHGHRSAPVLGALRNALACGTVLGLTQPAELELARLVLAGVPSAEQVRFTVTGTEACMTALRLARAATGRSVFLAFDGCYHGHADAVMAGQTAGIPEELAHHRRSVPYGDLAAAEAIMQREGGRIAAILVEPVAANMGVVVPPAGFLAGLRRLADAHGAVLIFDEVVTGFRLGPQGAQGAFGVRPDLTTLGKIIGGGMPIGAVAGPRHLMRRLAPEGDVYHAGTFAGHLLSMAAGIAALRALAAHPPYRRLEQATQRLTATLQAAADAAGVPVAINQAGSMFTVFFSASLVRTLAEAQSSRRDQFAAWAKALRRRSVLVPPSPLEACFVSTAHTPAHLRRIATTARAAFAEVARLPEAP